MSKQFVASTLVTALALWVTTLIVKGIHFDYGDMTSGLGKFGIIVLVAVIFGLVNGFIRPIVRLVSIPLYILTLGLIHFVINALMLMLASWLTGFLPWGLKVDGFWWAVLGSLVISVAAWIIEAILPDRYTTLADGSRARV